MNKSKIKAMVIFIGLIASTTLPFSVMSSSSVTLEGEVNDNFQIISDGIAYDVADTEKGNFLVEEHIGEKVKVTGTIEEEEEVKTIKITDFELMAE
jgi:hypothetical protein